MTEFESNIPEQVKTQHEQAMAGWQNASSQIANEEPTTAAEPEPPEESTAPETVETVTPSDTTDWQHKYNVLKGKYDAELPRTLDEARYWQDRCSQLQEAVNAARSQVTPALNKDEIEIPPELADTLGDDAARIVAKMLADQRKAIESQLGTQLKTTAQLSQQSAESNFWGRVRQAIPNYEELQNDSGINAWLAQPWPGSRRTRLNEAQEAVQRFDADAFIGLLQAYQPAATPEPNRKPPAPTPRRAAGGGDVRPTPTMTTAEYQAKAQRIIELRQDSRYQEAAGLQKELEAAKRAGQIQGRVYVDDFG